MNAHALFPGNSKHPERVRIPQVGFLRERLLGERVEIDAEPLAQAVALQALELGRGIVSSSG